MTYREIERVMGGRREEEQFERLDLSLPPMEGI